MLTISFKLFLESESAVELKAKILASAFLRSIRNAGGEIYFVGGAVRDMHLNRPSKDIDAMVKGVPLQTLATILAQHGKVNEVGQSFGIIKFSPNEFSVSEPLDIAIPRTERPMNPAEKEQYKTTYGKYPSAYQAFTTNSDHSLGVEEDLKRRDFTINAMAQDQHGNLIDPHNGMMDIKNKQIRMVDPKAFSQDPLRMLRAVQFAARFGFNIEPATFEEIRKNVSLISGIPGERILIEIEKIISKGDQLVGAKLLCKTSLWQEITKLQCKDFGSEVALFQKSKSIAEFMFLMLYGVTDFNGALKICNKLKCELVTIKQLKALYLAWEKRNDPHMTVFKMNQIHPTSLKLKVLPDEISEALNSPMPKSYGDLEINGDDLMLLGLKEQEIGKALNAIIEKIFAGELQNSKDELVQFVQTKIQKPD
jgi:tRNA nucleotidyltransferase/poly(A) polymerase